MSKLTVSLLLVFVAACGTDDFTTADAGGDAAPSDAGAGDVVNDAGGPDSPFDASATFCDTQTGNVVLCEDFDRGPLAGWTPDSNNNAPPPVTVTSPSKSAPVALKMSSAAPDGGPSVMARYLRVVTPAAVNKSTLDAEINVTDAAVPNESDFIVALAFGLAGTGGSPVALHLTSAGWACQGPNGAVSTVSSPISKGTWHHVKLEATQKGGNVFDVTCRVDLQTATLSSVSAPGAANDRRLVLGHQTFGAAGPVLIYLDDFVFRSE